MSDLIERLLRLSSGDEVSGRTYRSEIEAVATEITCLTARYGKAIEQYYAEAEKTRKLEKENKRLQARVEQLEADLHTSQEAVAEYIDDSWLS